MATTRAIILAAGSGTRLRPLTNDRPKCLLDVGGRPIIDHQLESLFQLGVSTVTIVVGYRADQIRRHLGQKVRYIDNGRFERTNSLYSLWLARGELASGALILNSDVLAMLALFDRLLRSPAPDAILVEQGDGFEPEDMKVELNGAHVVDFGKDLPRVRAHAHNVGVAKFSDVGGARLAGCLEQLVATGHENDWAPVAFKAFAQHWALTAVPTEGLPWVEIDTEQDLRRARHETHPAMALLEARQLVR